MWNFELDLNSKNLFQNYELCLDRAFNEYNIPSKSQEMVKKRLFSFLEDQIQLFKRRNESTLAEELNSLISELGAPLELLLSLNILKKCKRCGSNNRVNQERCNSCGGPTVNSINTLGLNKYILFWIENWSKAHPLGVICVFLLIGSFLGITSLINILIPLLFIGLYSALSYKKRELMTAEERYSEFLESKLTTGLFLVTISISLACYFSDKYFFSYSNIVTKIIIIITVTIVSTLFLIHRFFILPNWDIFDHITAYKKCQDQISTLDRVGMMALPLFAILSVLVAFGDISSMLEHFYHFISLIMVLIIFFFGIIYLFMLKPFLMRGHRLLFAYK